MIYLDASALVKLLVDEPESAALSAAIAGQHPYTTSIVGEIETNRACARAKVSSEQIGEALQDLLIVDLDESVRRLAALAGPPMLRTLDAIHLATAQSLGEDLDALVTYDVRLASAAEAAGLPVLSPA